jgi:hypothetical protein
MTFDTTLESIMERFRDAEEYASQQRGGFSLFGLFEREDVPGRWDLVASAPWLRTGRAGIRELVDLLGAVFSVQDWNNIAKIIATVLPLEPSAPFVRAATHKYNAEHQITEVTNAILNGIPVSRAFIITANASPSEKAEYSAAA